MEVIMVNSLRRSLGELPVCVSSDEDEKDTSTDTDGEPTPLDALLADLHLAASDPDPMPFTPPPLVPQESFFIPAEVDDLADEMHNSSLVAAPKFEALAAEQRLQAVELARQSQTAQPKIIKNIDPLADLVGKLANKKLRKTIKTPADLCINGRNILHYLAAAPAQFEKQQKLLSDRRIKPLLCQLLTQEAPNTKETVLHVISLHQNAPMLDGLLNLKDPDVIEALQISGKQLTEPTKCNAFLALGHSLLDEKVGKLFSHTLALLVQLYGRQEAIILVQTSRDQHEYTLLNLAILSKHNRSIETVSQLMTAKE